MSLLGVWLTLRLVPESKGPRGVRVDRAGTAACAACAGGTTYAVVRAGEDGWTSGATLGWFAGAAVALCCFVLVERRVAHPLLDLSLLRRPAFVGVLLGALAFNGVAFGVIPYLSIWMQTLLGPRAHVAVGVRLGPRHGAGDGGLCGRRGRRAGPVPGQDPGGTPGRCDGTGRRDAGGRGGHLAPVSRAGAVRGRSDARRAPLRTGAGAACGGRADSVEITAPNLTHPSVLRPTLPHVRPFSSPDQHGREHRSPLHPLPPRLRVG